MLIKVSQTTILYGERALGDWGPRWVSVLSAVERLTNPLIERAPLHLAFKLLNQLQIYIYIYMYTHTNKFKERRRKQKFDKNPKRPRNRRKEWEINS